jgi:hypothetical protein
MILCDTLHPVPTHPPTATAGAPLDIYSFGILMAELVMGPDIVYLGVRPGDLLQRVAREELRPEIPTYIPADYR